jgi:hypothetical protein
VRFEKSKLNQKHVRAGAAKVVEIVAENRPELVAPHLSKLLPALSVEEPQTRWAIKRSLRKACKLQVGKALSKELRGY